MRYIIGFDLGTHQTKICILDAANPDNKFYEFMEFENTEREASPLLPSIVQINEDKTVSYGYVDLSLQMPGEGYESMKPRKPVLQDMPVEPKPPEYVEPACPERPALTWKDKVRALLHLKTSRDEWEQKCKNISEQAWKEWKDACEMNKIMYTSLCESVRKNNEDNLESYREELAKWIEEKGGKYVFRYFKQKAFTGIGKWDAEAFSAEEVTVWYIAYVLHLVKEKIGDDFVAQFGVPIGNYNSANDKRIRERAYCLYVAAYNLYAKYADVNAYRKASYEELRGNTHIAAYVPDAEKGIFDDLPEAYAGLFPLVDSGYINGGFNLLVDIGGGTTDMALFCVNYKERQPDVIEMKSIQKGLNYIFEKSSDGTLKDLRKMQERFRREPEAQVFTDSIEEYHEELKALSVGLSDRLWKAFNFYKKRDNLSKSSLRYALENQRVIYCGGGSVYEILHQQFPYFTDIKCINQQLLNINNLINVDHIPNNLYPILATSYGLASYQKKYGEDEVKCTPVEDVFRNIFSEDTDESRHYDYEYGITDT